MHYAFRFTTGQFATSARGWSPGENLTAWLRARLVESAEEAEIEEPSHVGGVWTLWLDIGGDRFQFAVRGGTSASEWLVSVEHQAPMFVRGHEGHARHQARFDVLVAQLRQIILQAQGARLLAETDD